MKMKMRKLALVVGTLVMAGGAMAADTSTMGATASVAAACTVGAGTDIALGSLVMLTADGTQTGVESFSVGTTFPAICTKGTPTPKFTFVSANPATSTDFRLMGGTDASEFIAYTPYPSLDATGTAIVGTEAVAYPGFTANGVSQPLALSAKILATDKAGKSVQSYSDTITITASFGSL